MKHESYVERKGSTFESFEEEVANIKEKWKPYRREKIEEEFASWFEKNLPDGISWYYIIKRMLTLLAKKKKNLKDYLLKGFKVFLRRIENPYSLGTLTLKRNGRYESSLWENIENPTPKISTLPPRSVLVKIDFRLRSPFVSHDDEDFYIIESPVCKEKVFKIPYLRASSWKGVLRNVAMKERLFHVDSHDPDYYINERLKLYRLFGNEKQSISCLLNKMFEERLGEKESLRRYKEEREKYSTEDRRRGRIVTYPTFFDGIDLDVITPHDREKRTVRKEGPIQFEIVPQGAKGTFTLLYVPFDLIGRRKGKMNEIAEDLKVLRKTIPNVFLKYGFGAKTSSSYGLSEKGISFRINEKEGEGSSFKGFRDEFGAFIQEILREEEVEST